MDTIFAPLTGKGLCSIFIVRISGNKVFDCLKKLGITKKINSKEAIICNIFDEDKILDYVLFTYFKSPNSFTGEDVVEISIHCSNYIINRLYEILLSIKGVRFAEAGEFSKRAFLNGKFDLMQAESINDLIKAETKLQHSFAINQLHGKNSIFFESLRGDLVYILSLLEAFIDFPEEDISFNIQNEVETKIKNTICQIEKNLNDNNIGERIKDGFQIAIIGKPNSGKSTLLNYLAKRDIAIVSNIAGTTRDILEVNLNIYGIPVTLYDTAGIRNTKNIVENEGVKRAINKAKDADLKILVIDINDFNLEKNILNLIDDKTIILLNKIDIKNNAEFQNLTLDCYDSIKISLKDQINLNEFIDVLYNKLNNMILPNKNTNITNKRYRNELVNSLEYLKKFDINLPIEINAEHIRIATNHIGNITGKVYSTEILNNIFSKFCIGK